MVVHKCNVCFKEFSKKSHYDQHKNKKFSCKPNTQNYTEIPQNKTDIPKNYTENTQNHTKNTENDFDNNKNNCKYCLKKFSRSDSLNRHLQTCKIIKLENEKKQNIYNNLVENDILKKQMEEIIENNNKITEELKKQNEELKKQNERKQKIYDNLIENEAYKDKIKLVQKIKELKKEFDLEIFNTKNNNTQIKKSDIDKINKNIKKLEEIIPYKESKLINDKLINIIVNKEKKIDELVNNKDQCKIVIVDENEKELNNKPNDLIINNQVIVCREIDNYINATQLCKAGGKKFNDWFRLDSTKELILELEKSNKSPDTGNPASATSIQKIYIEKNVGGNDKNNQNTWIDPDLAIQLAQWISPQFAIQVSKWIRTLFSNGKVKINSQLLKEKNKRIKLLEDLTLQKQKRINYPDSNVIYLLTTEDNKKKRIYIVGKAESLKARLSTYNKTSEHEVVYYKGCKNKKHMNLVERMVLDKLEEYKEKANRDRFILPIEQDIKFFKDLIDECINF